MCCSSAPTILRVSWKVFSSDQWGFSAASSVARRLWSLKKTTCTEVRAGVSLIRPSPARKQVVDSEPSLQRSASSCLGNTGFLDCSFPYWSKPNTRWSRFFFRKIWDCLLNYWLKIIIFLNFQLDHRGSNNEGGTVSDISGSIALHMLLGLLMGIIAVLGSLLLYRGEGDQTLSRLNGLPKHLRRAVFHGDSAFNVFRCTVDFLIPLPGRLLLFVLQGSPRVVRKSDFQKQLFLHDFWLSNGLCVCLQWVRVLHCCHLLPGLCRWSDDWGYRSVPKNRARH